MHLDDAGVEVLDRDECLALMATVPIGRIVFTDRAMPAVQPVNFILDGDEVVIRTAAGSKLAAAVRNAIVAFEVDEFDAAARSGWSVTITGRAREVRDPDEARLLLESPLQPWAPGEREHFIRISSAYVTGRRVLPAARAVG